MRLRRLLPLALILAVPAIARGDDAQDRAYEFQMKRARELAGPALRSMDRGLLQEAVDAFRAAARLRPSDSRATMEAGMLLLEMGDGAGAARMLAETHERAPESGDFHFLRGALLEARGEFRDAGAEFAKCVEKEYRVEDSRNRYFRCRLGHGLQLVDAWTLDEALAVLEEAVALRPDHPLVSRGYYNIAVVHRRLRQPKEAERVLRECMAKFPSYAPAYGELGDLLSTLDRHDEALEVLSKSVRVDPQYAQGYLLKATALSERGRFEEAGRAFEEFGKRFPPTAESEYRLGVHHHRRGEPKKGLEHLRHSLALDPTRARAHYYVALCHRDLGEDAKAEEAMERWRKADEAARAAHDHRIGQAQEEVGEGEDGKEEEKEKGNGGEDGGEE